MVPLGLAVGVFDGVHRGHQQLLDVLASTCRDRGARSVVVTFDPTPRELFQPDSAPRWLTDPDERVALLQARVEVVQVWAFTREVADLTADEFLDRVEARADGRIELLVGGPDLAIGRDRHARDGELRAIAQRRRATLDLLPEAAFDGQPIRSGVIRNLIERGDVAAAARLLGRSPGLTGWVERGHGRGRTIGVPTANLRCRPGRLLPAHGVYVSRASVEGAIHPAVTNVGVRPTIDGSRVIVEVHLLDFSADLYDRSIEITFEKRLRDEQRFPDLNALVHQIRRDIEVARAYFRAT
ncbi:MAG: riboflavin biosynthesis protein RibF [Chloroflexi bacterium]|nr:riboflavin biosynthesis protein RibF [Chloroflexota bacterium]